MARFPGILCRDPVSPRNVSAFSEKKKKNRCHWKRAWWYSDQNLGICSFSRISVVYRKAFQKIGFWIFQENCIHVLFIYVSFSFSLQHLNIEPRCCFDCLMQITSKGIAIWPQKRAATPRAAGSEAATRLFTRSASAAEQCVCRTALAITFMNTG